MPLVPELNLPKKDFGKWIPEKQEKHNLRYWKAKKSKPTPVKKLKIKDYSVLKDYSENAIVNMLKDNNRV